MHPTLRNGSSRQASAFRRALRSTDAFAFFNLLTDEATLDQVEGLLPAHRERLLPPTATLAMFIAQVLSADGSCQNAVDAFVAGRVAMGLAACSTATGAYCRARSRLPLEMVWTLARHVGRELASTPETAWTWRGRRVRLADGSTLTLADTAANQALFPQPDSQAPGLGFPRCRILVLLCLASGALMDAASCPYQGKGSDEQSLLRQVLGALQTGEVLMGDAHFATYFLWAELGRRGIDGVFEQHGARRKSIDFRRGRRLGPRDHLIDIAKPRSRPDWMSPQAYEAAPDRLTVRELCIDGKTLVTSMLCPKQVPKAELKALYRQRWHVELDLRHLKATLGMEHLRCKTPSMALKEMWVYLLAYNLIRRLMAHAAQAHRVPPRHLSFKHAVQLWLAWHQSGNDPDDPGLYPLLLRLVAQPRVGQRTGRIEPRAVKRRRTRYPLLKQPRAIERHHIIQHGHPPRAK